MTKTPPPKYRVQAGSRPWSNWRPMQEWMRGEGWWWIDGTVYDSSYQIEVESRGLQYETVWGHRA